MRKTKSSTWTGYKSKTKIRYLFKRPCNFFSLHLFLNWLIILFTFSSVYYFEIRRRFFLCVYKLNHESSACIYDIDLSKKRIFSNSFTVLKTFQLNRWIVVKRCNNYYSSNKTYITSIFIKNRTQIADINILECIL